MLFPWAFFLVSSWVYFRTQSVPVPGSIYSKILESKSEVVTSRTNISKKSCQGEKHNQVLQTKLSLRRRECFILKLTLATVSSLLVRPQGHKYTVMLIIIFNSYKEHVKTVSCIIISIILVYLTLLLLWSKGLHKPRLSCWNLNSQCDEVGPLEAVMS